jgi:hypothetical protein
LRDPVRLAEEDHLRPWLGDTRAWPRNGPFHWQNPVTFLASDAHDQERFVRIVSRELNDFGLPNRFLTLFRATAIQYNWAKFMVIGRTQMDAFEAYARESFHLRLTEYVRAVLPDRTKHFSEAEFENLIIDAEVRAKRCGVVTQRGIAKWFCLALMAGQKFDEIPEVNLVLTHSQMEGEQRLDLLFESLCLVAQRNS